MWLGGSSFITYGHSHHEKMGVSQIIGLASQPSRSWSAWWRNFTILKNMSSSMGRIIIPYGKIVSTPLKNMRSSVGMMTFLTEWKNVPNHQTVFFPESVWAKGYSNSGGLSNIFTYSHLLIFTSSHINILSCPLAVLPSCSLLLFYFSLAGAGQCQRDSTKRNPFARNEVRSPKTGVKLRFLLSGHNPFARHEVRSTKTEVKFQFSKRPAQRFRTKWGSIAKNCSKIAICKASGEPVRTKWGSIAKDWGKNTISRVRSLCVKVFVCESFCV